MSDVTRRRYRGLLARPLCPYRDTDAEAAIANRISVLFEEFLIDAQGEHAWERLAMSLAFRHVPGFGYPSTGREIKTARGGVAGRKSDLTKPELARLISLVELSGSKKKIAINREAKRTGISAEKLQWAYYRHRKHRQIDRSIDWTSCKKNPSHPCINAEMDVAECIAKCARPTACALRGSILARVKLLSPILDQLRRIEVWRAKRAWASPVFRPSRRKSEA